MLVRQPLNDNFAGAILLPFGVAVAGDNTGAGSEPGEPVIADSGRTVWFYIIAPQGSGTSLLRVSTELITNYDTVLAVYL